MANFLRFTNPRDIGLVTLVQRCIPRRPLCRFTSGGRYLPTALSSGAAYDCDCLSASPARHLDYSSKPQSAALFSFNILPQWRFLRMAEASGFRAEGII